MSQNGQLVVESKTSKLSVNNSDCSLVITSSSNSLVVDATKRGAQGEQGEQGERGSTEIAQFTAGENLTSFKPIALINDLAVLFDAGNIAHLNAFAGFSINSATVGNFINVQQIGTIEMQGWGLIAGQAYLASLGGTITTINSTELFCKQIGYAVTSEKMQIIKDSTPIIRQND